jgi:hypothetical protein
MTTKSRYVGGVLTHFDPAKKYSYTRRDSRYHFHSDFDELATIPASGSRANGSPWVQQITGAAPPTVTLVADAIGGAAAFTLTSDSQAQDATIHFDDNRHVSLDQGAVFQAYARLTTLPTLLGIAHLGLVDDKDPSFLATSYNVGFTIAAGGVVSCNMDDNVTPLAVASGVTMAVNTWYSFRIEAISISNIKFFIDGAVVAGSTAFSMAAVTGTANAVLQPFAGIGKASGAGVGVMQLDTVDIWQH